MRVRCSSLTLPAHLLTPDLVEFQGTWRVTLHAEYDVFALYQSKGTWFIDFEDDVAPRPAFAPLGLFEIIDPRVPPDWNLRLEGQRVVLQPREMDDESLTDDVWEERGDAAIRYGAMKSRLYGFKGKRLAEGAAVLTAQISGSFLLQKAALSLPELRWAFDNGVIGARTVVDVAIELLGESDDPLTAEIAGVLQADLPSVAGLVDRIPLAEGREPEIWHKWVWLILSWVYEHHHQDADLLAVIESLYADLGYPEEMHPFGPYGPASEGDPRDRHERVLGALRKYLDDGAARFGRARSGVQ